MTYFHLTTLGCAKNRTDTEVVLADLISRGFNPVEELAQAEIIIVNTCAFIQPAVEESVDHLLKAAELKKSGKARLVVGLGCLPERYGPDLPGEMAEVDLFVGASAVGQAGRRIQDLVAGRRQPQLIRSRPRFLYGAATPRTLTTPPGTAYVKIAEGCPNRCAFCTIPAIRGRQQSRSLDDIAAEVANLADKGISEINLAAQDLTAYGRDLDPPASLAGLLKILSELEPAPPWIRLLYLNPARVDQELLDIAAASENILPYLDLPLQHAVGRLIKKMGRRPPAKDLLGWLENIRTSLPGAILRTTFMVGYPTESEDEFEALLEFIGQARFDHLGAFTFWPEEGVRAAALPGQVPQRLAQERLERLMALQAEISLANNRAWEGQRVDVLVEGRHPESDLLLTGRAWFQAPEVDGSIIIRAGTGHPGRIQPARIVEAHTYDLVAELEEEPPK